MTITRSDLVTPLYAGPTPEFTGRVDGSRATIAFYDVEGGGALSLPTSALPLLRDLAAQIELDFPQRTPELDPELDDQQPADSDEVESPTEPDTTQEV